MKAALANLEREVDASRNRLMLTVGELRDHLVPRHLIEETFEQVGWPHAPTVLQRVETAIRNHPWPMMLMAVGGTMWIVSHFQGRGEPIENEARGVTLDLTSSGSRGLPISESLKENVVAIGQSAAESAHQIIRSRILAKLEEYRRSFREAIGAAADGLMQEVERSLGRTFEGGSTSEERSPLVLSIAAVLLGAALRGRSSTPRHS